jgi:hypothetical protein
VKLACGKRSSFSAHTHTSEVPQLDEDEDEIDRMAEVRSQVLIIYFVFYHFIILDAVLVSGTVLSESFNWCK